MSEHTPGLWYVAEKSMWHSDVRFVRTSEDMSGVVGVVSNDQDAKLIAAAPDLLESLCELQRWMLSRTGPSDGTMDMLIKAEVAIQRAKGQ